MTHVSFSSAFRAKNRRVAGQMMHLAKQSHLSQPTYVTFMLFATGTYICFILVVLILHIASLENKTLVLLKLHLSKYFATFLYKQIDVLAADCTGMRRDQHIGLCPEGRRRR